MRFPHTFSNTARPETHLHPHEQLRRATFAREQKKFLDTHIRWACLVIAWQVYYDFDRLWDYNFFYVDGLCATKLELVAGGRVAHCTPRACVRVASRAHSHLIHSLAWRPRPGVGCEQGFVSALGRHLYVRLDVLCGFILM